LADDKAKEVVAEWGREEAKQSDARSVWQSTADNIYPYVQITSEFTSGTNRMRNIPDITPIIAWKKMVAGFKQVLFPAGQTVFAIKVDSRLSNVEIVQRYLAYLTEATHEAIFASNFDIKLTDWLTHLIIFGPACMYREWKVKKGLNYRVSKVGSYVIFEDESENVIGSIHRFKLTAAQAVKLYGENAGKSVLKANEKPETRYNDFWFLFKVMPREINLKLAKTYNKNMPYEATIVNEADQIIAQEGGYPDNPYAICRWSRPEFEKDGRGVGTETLPQILYFYELAKNFQECANKWVNPPRQAKVNSVEGKINTFPGAVTWVEETDSIRAMDSALNGNYNVTEDTMERQGGIIKEAFYNNAFDPLQELTGDRRTTLEIQERIRGTLKHLGPPVGRIWGEGLTPILSGSIMDLIHHRQVMQPPPELGGVNFNLEYVGPLAMALKSEQARGFQEFINFVGSATQVFPEEHLEDHVDFNDAIPRIGRTFGVNIEDIATTEERDRKRQSRAQIQQQQQMLMAAQAAGTAYKDASGTPEQGSPAEILMAGSGK
jgi:hypothetical protein